MAEENANNATTGTGWPEAAESVDAGTVGVGPAGEAGMELEPAGDDSAVGAAVTDPPRRFVVGRLSSAAVMIGLLLALLGFAIIVQVKSTSTDSGLSAARLQDLVRIQSDLEAREQRLRQELASLEESQRQLTSGAQRRQAALEEATRRADELGILAGTLPARGPGLSLLFVGGAEPIKASAMLDAVQELRGAGAEAMEIIDSAGVSARVIASTYFLDGQGGALIVGGRGMTGPFTLLVIGDPTTMRTALNIPGGVVASVKSDGGNVTVQEREVVNVEALSELADLRYARPVS